MARRPDWHGVFPAVTTQFREDLSLDLEATGKVISALVRDGVSGLVVLGTVGENTALGLTEKVAVLEIAQDSAAGRVPVIAGVAEYTSAFGATLAREAERVGIDGLMAMPPMVYATNPIMIYNNPPAYRTDVTPAMLKQLASVDTIVAFKESSGDTRRFIDIRNLLGDRFIPFCGLDDVVLESVAVGAVGWVSGLSNVFPREGETLFRLASAGRMQEALALYEWFMPLLHLDARPDLVQAIKLCERIMGRGIERTRPPRLALDPGEVAEIESIMGRAISRRPALPDVGLPAAA